MEKTIERPRTVYFFGTCLVDAIYPRTGLAAMDLLKDQGLAVIFPQNQSCCGQPAFNTGFLQEARQVALAQVRAFPRPYPVVVPSGSCAGMMRCHYPELFAGTVHEDAVREFSGRVFELFEFMVRVLDVKLVDRGKPMTVTWHSSCHALREMKVVGYAKELIGQLKNVTLVELAREEECCGFGGTFAVKQPSISAAMVRDKVQDIADTGAGTFLAGDCGCLMNITGAMDRAGVTVAGRHLAQFLWERTHGR